MTISPISSAMRSCGQSVAPGMAASDHSKNRGQSSSGTPSRSLITRSGNGTASSPTTSTASPAGSAATARRARARMTSSSLRITDGANAGCTSLRYRVWAGGSVCIIVGGVS